MDNKSQTLRESMHPELNGRASNFARSNFWHYTSLASATKIVAGERPGFFASRLDVMNDIDEAELHNENKEKIFCLSFCNTDKEKIPMWYMYSDKEGKGVSLGVTPARMRDFINDIEIVYPVVNNQALMRKRLVKGVDFELHTGWVAYRNQCEPSNYHFRGKWHDRIDAEFERDNYFIKLYPRYYEDEFRLVFKFKEDCKFDKIYIPLGQLKFKLMIGPGYYDKENERFVPPIYEHKIFLQPACESKLKICMKR